ncbi:MAG: hypothetical protein EBV71_06430, partial [Chitinophagia bacterium]|nr:hypothetical protein [Chitinophagia bacterium]
MPFQLHSSFTPAGDQPEAIRQLTEGLLNGEKYQTLLGVTGSGKTFTMANVIQQVQRPTLVLTHNKTLVAQLYGEFRQFFPDNAVEYFVSYYDYYQPEAYMPVSDTYIEKDLSINEELDKLRLRATSSLLSGRRDIIVVASVSCIYGMGNPVDYQNGIIRLEKGQVLSRQAFLHGLVNGYCSGIENYSRFFDRRKPGTRPFCLLDYFPSDYLLLLDESHQTVPQVSGMYGGDRSRKLTLVDYGFRLPSALDNRPLNF